MALYQQTNQSQDPLTIALSIAFYAFIFISMFYGQKIQFYRYLWEVNNALQKLKNIRDEAKISCKTKIIELRKQVNKHAKEKESPIQSRDLDKFLDEFLQFVMIQPVSLDPAGIIPKLDHLINVRENRWNDTVLMLIPGLKSRDASNLENLLEAAMAIDTVYRVVRHFYVQSKKTKSLILIMNIAMQIKLIMQMVDAYKKATQAFYHGQPIGDAFGPQVAATFIRKIQPDGKVDYEDICKDTIVQKILYKDRNVYVIRAKGPGGTVGKPGEGIKILIDRLKGNVKRIIMIDAAMKFEGERTGAIVEGVGAAIGGIGVERFKIEESSTKKKIPIDCFLCKQSLFDAITTMKKSISNSVKEIVERICKTIEIRTKEGDNVIVAVIGN
ncbi:MAG: DUF1512 family protein, partial [Promethearchaeota archaeon]